MLELRDWNSDAKRWGRSVSGTSMEPFLRDLDIAIFEEMEPAEGDIVHVSRATDDTIKVYRIIDGVPMLTANSGTHKPFAASGWQIRGVCIGYIRSESDGSTTERIYPRSLSGNNPEVAP